MKIPLAALVAVVGFGAAEPLLKPTGVCDISEGAIACWDDHGAANPGLEREIRSRLNENTLFGFYQGQKNRYFFAWQDVGSPIRTFSTTGSSAVSFLPKTGERTLVAVRTASGAASKSGTASLNLGVLAGAPVEMRLREGEVAMVDGIRITLGRPEVSPQGLWPGYTPTPWRFGVDRPESELATSVSFEALDGKGQLIQYVDEWGKPADAAKGKAIYDQIQAGKWDWRTPVPIMNAAVQDWSFVNPGQRGVWMYTNIDPKSITRLRVRRVVQQSLTLGPFPLDPVQSKTP
jgi:hypothetical protein